MMFKMQQNLALAAESRCVISRICNLQ